MLSKDQVSPSSIHSPRGTIIMCIAHAKNSSAWVRDQPQIPIARGIHYALCVHLVQYQRTSVHVLRTIGSGYEAKFGDEVRLVLFNA